MLFFFHFSLLTLGNGRFRAWHIDILLCQHLQNFYGFRCYWVIDHSWLGGKQLSYQGQFPKVPVTVTWTPEFQYSYPICKLNIYMLGLHFDQTKKQSLFLIRVILTCTWMISQWSSNGFSPFFNVFFLFHYFERHLPEK